DQPDVHALRGGPVERPELKPQLQAADQGTVQRRAPPWPGDAAEPGERGKDQPRASEAQHEQRKGARVIERDPGCRVTRAPQEHERGAEYASRNSATKIALPCGALKWRHGLLVQCAVDELLAHCFLRSLSPARPYRTA